MKFHRPPQITQSSETTYFITSRTYGGIPHLAGDEKRNLFKKILYEKVEKFSGVLKNWVILNNHCHLLVEFLEGDCLSEFIKELHGASSFAIKKLPVAVVPNEEQILLREITPMERRMEERIEDVWCKLKFASTRKSVVVDFSPRLQNVIVDFGRRKPSAVADFSQRLKEALNNNDYPLFKVLLLSIMSDVPFWSSYMSHVIRNEKDYFQHFNYITQNPIKHGVVKNPWEYQFSGIFEYEKEFILDALEKYPIIDFGGNYD